VINKIDRLILELDLTPSEAYSRITAIVSHVNMILSSFESEKFISEADAVLAHEDAMAQYVEHLESDDEAENADYFSPEKGNVAFASAHDGWAFTIHQFARIYAHKLGCKEEPLYRALWGNFVFHPKTKRIARLKSSSSEKPLFVQWILDPIWKAYEACRPGVDHKSILRTIGSKLKVSEGIQKAASHQDPKIALKGLMRGWLPLSDAVLEIGRVFLPSPDVAAPKRKSRLLPSVEKTEKSLAHSDLSSELAIVDEAINSCDSSQNGPVVIYVSKMISVPITSIPRRPNDNRKSINASDEVFLAFGRVFCGIIREGQAVHVLQATYDPEASDISDSSVSEAVITDIYLMMGRGLERLDSVPAGNILALGGLDTSILKSATVSSTRLCRPLAPLTFQAAPIVQVAVEPSNPGDMEKLDHGLQLLHRADPLVKVSLQDSGEHVVSAAGEVHLETCIKDLRERFARINLVVSPPLVSFKESIAEEIKEPRTVEGLTAGKGCLVRVRVWPLPDSLSSQIEANSNVLNKILGLNGESSKNIDLEVDFLAALKDSIENSLLNSTAINSAKRIWLLGPKGCGPNILLASSATNSCERSIWKTKESEVAYLYRAHPPTEETDPEKMDEIIFEIPIVIGKPVVSTLLHLYPVQLNETSEGYEKEITAHLQAAGVQVDYDKHPAVQDIVKAITSAIHAAVAGIATGFQLATGSGPLCDEPLRGVMVEIEAKLRVTVSRGDSTPKLLTQEDVFGPFSGQVSSVVRQAIRKGILENKPRIVEAYFLCEIATSSEGLSAVYAVLGRRRARILREELREGSGLFSILSHLPVESSFGFADELRQKSSGNASASLMLSHWERLPVDPFFQPLTEEEREEFGEEGQGMGAPNLARKMIDSVRRRKGLPVEEKVVESATKQRTRARKV